MQEKDNSGIYYGSCEVPKSVEACSDDLTKRCAAEMPESPLCYTETKNGFGYCTKSCKDDDEDKLSCEEEVYLRTDKCEDVSGKKMIVSSGEKCTTKCDDSGEVAVCK